MVVLLGVGLGWVMGIIFGVLANRYVPYLAEERPGRRSDDEHVSPPMRGQRTTRR